MTQATGPVKPQGAALDASACAVVGVAEGAAEGADELDDIDAMLAATEELLAEGDSGEEQIQGFVLSSPYVDPCR